ncbi:2-hydroxyacid dehydrogenase [Clostridium manihotivorum]|uniref:Hydroxyacid dehydrogenase n=1 Tax=Clostridium manihotivorum TaxID=2320868 RepID=A0A3R5U8Y0_9CLOT|nr:2-hydroxyacid dehydrogenase [Clostridium manihotivorum]QAA35147.1 hydroxyacid dehydrogenase [Clostridium manihotivorum]
MKIVLLEPLGISKDTLTKLASDLIDKGHEFIAYDTVEKDTEMLKNRASGADILMIANSPLCGEVIRSVENLKYIAVAFTGVDHVDKAACEERGITVSNAKGYATEAVAELTIGMIISLLRNVKQCDDVARKEGTKLGLVGTELNGKTVGIVGTGDIGIRTAEILKAFNCKLLGYSRTERIEGKDLGINYVSLEDLLKNSDIVSLHVPLTDSTNKLINKDNLHLMKRNAILINMARGPVVDSDALAEALNNGTIAGAGIDVFEVEPPVKACHPLFNSKNTLVTPHIAFATDESMVKRADIVFDNVYSWINGEKKNIVF